MRTAMHRSRTVPIERFSEQMERQESLEDEYHPVSFAGSQWSHLDELNRLRQGDVWLLVPLGFAGLGGGVGDSSSDMIVRSSSIRQHSHYFAKVRPETGRWRKLDHLLRRYLVLVQGPHANGHSNILLQLRQGSK